MTELTKVEGKILEAAKEEFAQKGYEGGRMQSIANRAGISKAALHYYFRSKEKLFKKVVNSIFNLFFQDIEERIQEETTFEKKVKTIIELYLNTIMQHRNLVFFVFSELMKHPQILDEMIGKQDEIASITHGIKAEQAKGTIRSIDPRQLIINVVSMCIYPILGQPLIVRLLDFSDEEYDEFLHHRKDQIYEFVMKSLRP